MFFTVSPDARDYDRMMLICLKQPHDPSQPHDSHAYAEPFKNAIVHRTELLIQFAAET